MSEQSLFSLAYGDLVVWEGAWHEVANVTPSTVWLINLERLDALPFLAEERQPCE